jgi:hypothetical protein
VHLDAAGVPTVPTEEEVNDFLGLIRKDGPAKDEPSWARPLTRPVLLWLHGLVLPVVGFLGGIVWSGHAGRVDALEQADTKVVERLGAIEVQASRMEGKLDMLLAAGGLKYQPATAEGK